MNSDFGGVSPEEWKLQIDPSVRLLELSKLCPFEAIVERLRTSARIEGLEREQCERDSEYHRVVVELEVDACVLDLFHNSRCGYRAQYYLCPKLGEKANAYTIRVLAARIRELLPSLPPKTIERTGPSDWIELSLLHPHAKVWIHQGSWFRQRRWQDRNLFVERWLEGLKSGCPPDRKRATWAMLTPGQEDQLELKGGFVTRDFVRLRVPLKPGRSEDIWRLGFT